jgi:hypothetical protein
MSKSVWGPPTWILFHTLAEKIDETKFENHKGDLFFHIKQICFNLPCNECRGHATNFMSKIDINKCPNKENFKYLLFKFHNSVNKRKHLIDQNSTILEKYKEPVIEILIEIIINIYTKNPGNNQLMDSFHRHKAIYSFKKWYIENKELFK